MKIFKTRFEELNIDEKTYWSDYVKDYQKAISELSGIIKENTNKDTYDKFIQARFGLSDIIYKIEKSAKLK